MPELKASSFGSLANVLSLYFYHNEFFKEKIGSPVSITGFTKQLLAFGSGRFWVCYFVFVGAAPVCTTVGAGAEWQYWWLCVQFGGVTVVCILVAGGLTQIFSPIFHEEKWTVGKEIVFEMVMIMFIGLGNFLFAMLKFETPPTLSNLILWQWMTFAVGIFPTVFGIFWKEISLLKKHAGNAAQISREIESHSPQPSPFQKILLTGDNQNEQLELPANSVLYFSAEDNHVQIFWLKDGCIKQRLIRSNLKKMEEQLSHFPQFFRCHRTYIVHLGNVTEVSGNAQGYKLHFEGTDFRVPVSRNLNEIIRQKFLQDGVNR